jgi:hypothetical protein
MAPWALATLRGRLDAADKSSSLWQLFNMDAPTACSVGLEGFQQGVALLHDAL